MHSLFTFSAFLELSSDSSPADAAAPSPVLVPAVAPPPPRSDVTASPAVGGLLDGDESDCSAVEIHDRISLVRKQTVVTNLPSSSMLRLETISTSGLTHDLCTVGLLPAARYLAVASCSIRASAGVSAPLVTNCSKSGVSQQNSSAIASYANSQPSRSRLFTLENRSSSGRVRSLNPARHSGSSHCCGCVTIAIVRRPNSAISRVSLVCCSPAARTCCSSSSISLMDFPKLPHFGSSGSRLDCAAAALLQ
mmetsp:Transcript_73231/g.122274  ORF Transcript_73231/g.122274 Transcript_73231/m.122274 type:complete len:250 (+) Transcript_73231:826-1575(+)